MGIGFGTAEGRRSIEVTGLDRDDVLQRGPDIPLEAIADVRVEPRKAMEEHRGIRAAGGAFLGKLAGGRWRVKGDTVKRTVLLRVLVFMAALAAALVTARMATAAVPSLTLTPPSVKRGHTVLIKGSADGCAVGNTVFIISKAFVHTHDFAGLPAVLAKVKYGGSFRITTTIPAAKRPGRYSVTARCGGGNFGILKHLIVRH